MPENNFEKADHFIFVTGFNIVLDGEIWYRECGHKIYKEGDFHFVAGKYSTKQRVQSILKDLPFIKKEDVEVKTSIQIFDLKENKIV